MCAVYIDRSLVVEIILLCLRIEADGLLVKNVVAIFCLMMIVVSFLQSFTTSSNGFEATTTFRSTAFSHPATFSFLWTHLVPGEVIQWLRFLAVDIDIVWFIVHIVLQLWFLFGIGLDRSAFAFLGLALLLLLFLHLFLLLFKFHLHSFLNLLVIKKKTDNLLGLQVSPLPLEASPLDHHPVDLLLLASSLQDSLLDCPFADKSVDGHLSGLPKPKSQVK